MDWMFFLIMMGGWLFSLSWWRWRGSECSTESGGSGGDTGGGGETATVLLPLTYQAGDLLHYHMYVLPTGLIVPTPSMWFGIRHAVWRIGSLYRWTSCGGSPPATVAAAAAVPTTTTATSGEQTYNDLCLDILPSEFCPSGLNLPKHRGQVMEIVPPTKCWIIVPPVFKVYYIRGGLHHRSRLWDKWCLPA